MGFTPAVLKGNEAQAREQSFDQCSCDYSVLCFEYHLDGFCGDFANCNEHDDQADRLVSRTKIATQPKRGDCSQRRSGVDRRSTRTTRS